MKKIKTAVIGAGYLGKFHVEKFATLPCSDLVAVCDTNAERCAEISKQYNILGFHDYKNLIDMVDAVSIAVPTPLHHETAMFFLRHGKHVLLEKPIAHTVEEADELITMAKKNNLLLQIGHLERFNNAIKALDSELRNPRFIESLRLAPFKLRGIDVNVVLDLMIHDIDIILSIVKSKITEIRATGASVLSPYIDIAHARLEFANGCVANVTASRVNLKMERVLRIFQSDAYIKLDLDRKNLVISRKGEKEMFPGIPEITREKITYDKGDALREEIHAFLDSIIQNKPAVVSGEDGKRALETAIEITKAVRKHNELFPFI